MSISQNSKVLASDVNALMSYELIATVTSWTAWNWKSVTLSKNLSNYRYLMMGAYSKNTYRRVFLGPWIVPELVVGSSVTDSEMWKHEYYQDRKIGIAIKGLATASTNPIQVMVTEIGTGGAGDWTQATIKIFGIV